MKNIQITKQNQGFVLPFLLFLCLMIPSMGQAQIGQFGKVKEKVMSHVESDPLTIGGQLGAEMNMSWNNQDIYGYSDPFAFAAYANFDIGIYGFHIPINLNLLNLSMTQFSFPHPQITINTTPEWKNFRFHIGTSSMHFNNYTYSGLTFTGLGAEYNGDILRVAGFYGKLNIKTRFKDERTAIQYFADSLLGINQQETTQPQFDRNAWGAKIGIGNTKNYIDFSVLKAKDDIESLPESWQYQGSDSIIYRDSILKGKENFTTGLAGRFSIGKWFAFNVNMAMSLYSDDMSSSPVTKENIPSLVTDTTDPLLQKAIGILDKARDIGIYDARLNTQVRFAGDAAMNFTFEKFSAAITYRLVQADFTSLGANKFSQNVQGVGASLNYRFFKNRSILMLSGFLQQDNLDDRQMYTNQVATYSANWNFNVSDNINFTASYSGVKQDQKDGTFIVNDTFRTDQIMHSLTFTPSYTIFGDNEHTISLNFNNVANKNQNALNPNGSNVNTLTIGAGYDCNITSKRVGIGANYDFSNSKAPGNDYTSHTVSGSLTYNAIKKDDMGLKFTGSVSLSYNIKPAEQSGYGGTSDDELPVSADYTTNEFSFSARIGSTFTYKTQHNASFFLSTSNYSENIVFGQKVSTTMDLRFNIAYSYSFFSRLIKSKKETERLKKQEKNERMLR